MKKRWMFLLLVVAGGLLLAGQFPPRIAVMPFPASTAMVRLELPVRFSGDYRVEVSMPNVDNKLTLSSETLSCNFLVSIEADEHSVVSQRITSMRTVSEYGFGNTQSFVAGDEFHLGRGTYDATITGGGDCPVATTRGASVTIARFETEHILGSLIVWAFAMVLILAGLIGLMLSEHVRRPNDRSTASAARREEL